MHEMGIANSILETVGKELQRYPGSRPVKVGVRIGELAAVDPEALSFSFEALTKDTEWEGLALEIEFRPRRHRCQGCLREFDVKDYDFQCPQCGEMNSECIGGEELDLAFLEVEEYEPSAVGAEGS
jgi:hydrogenase nickel incorporation protein HypA/HybF